MSDRRQFLSTLGKALGAGGLLLPVAGQKAAFAMPSDLAKVADIPLVAAKLPPTPEALLMREIRAELRAEYLRQCEGRSLDQYQQAWKATYIRYKAATHLVADKVDPTWADCVALAERIWHALPKESVGGRDTGALSTNGLYLGGCNSAHQAIVA
ncbi:MAG: hypothetical protein EKK41_19520, partial [Hyphomicrobiales bacterium]